MALVKHPASSSEPIERWEDAFESGLIATSRRDVPEPWLAGHVHVARGLPAQPKPVQTGCVDAHQVIVFDVAMTLREVVPGRPPHYDGRVGVGEMSLMPREVAAEENWSAWSEGAAFTSVMLPPATVVAAARALGRDYAGLEFVERYGHRDPFLRALIRQLNAELETAAFGGRLYAEELMQALAVHLVRHHTTEDVRGVKPRGGLPAVRLRRVEAYVEAHLSEDVRLEDLAGEAALSEYYFARLFRESTGESPHQYVIRRRMEAARGLLAETDWTVQRVAMAVGYDSASHFRTLFKRATGTTPSRFRTG